MHNKPTRPIHLSAEHVEALYTILDHIEMLCKQPTPCTQAKKRFTSIAATMYTLRAYLENAQHGTLEIP